jgi:broad specificity phosphatase PhoE
MTTFIFVRHAAHDLLGKILTGRAPGVHLNARGKMQAERLADRLSKLQIAAIYTGPLERAVETAGPLSDRFSLEKRLCPAFDEVDFGAWTSLTFAALDQRADWKAWTEPLLLKAKIFRRFKNAQQPNCIFSLTGIPTK